MDKIKGLNELELGQGLNELVDELQMITGNESVYHNYPRLAESVKNNLKKGIKEGIYLEGPKRIINGYSASGHRVLFFQDKVYKIRWTFERNDFPVLKEVFQNFLNQYTKAFGTPTDNIMEDTFVWKGSKNRLQLFMDDNSIQVELRDEAVETAIKYLKP